MPAFAVHKLNTICSPITKNDDNKSQEKLLSLSDESHSSSNFISSKVKSEHKETALTSSFKPKVQYVIEEETPVYVKQPNPSIYNTYKLSDKQNVIMRNNYLYLDPSAFSIVWKNVALFVVLHLFYVYSLYAVYLERRPYSLILCYLFGWWGGMGVTAGAHRLWSHRSYSARFPLKLFLMVGHTIAGQNNLYVWCRDHRVHHKFSETDGDPHNSLRGFFFAHMGWLLRKKHPNVFIKGNAINMEDLKQDSIIRFQVRYYYILYALFAFFIPTWIGAVYFNEGWWYSFLVTSIMRYATSLHCTWFVNSAAHMFGQRPYNTKINARENEYVSYAAFGEGYHNYHHSFPNDYATSELGSSLNVTKIFIDTMAYIGLAYNLKKMSPKLVSMRKANAALSESLLKKSSY